MSNQHNHNATELDNTNDIGLSKPSSSRFLFLLSFFGFFIFAWSGCYNLYEHKYQKPDTTPVPGNTLYEPTYK